MEPDHIAFLKRTSQVFYYSPNYYLKTFLHNYGSQKCTATILLIGQH